MTPITTTISVLSVAIVALLVNLFDEITACVPLYINYTRAYLLHRIK
jgi:hypothetical protein